MSDRPLPKYMPSVDGLRAIAIIAVVGFHLGLPYFSLGWAGVNLFFVISGFLITGILLDAKGSNNYFRNFYMRRALRIFPIYYMTFFLLVVFGLWRNWNINDWGYYLVYLQNYRLGAKGFAADFPGFFNHTWTLAIEEQFYLIWPLMVFTMARQSLKRLCIGLIVFAFLSRIFIYSVSDNYLLLFTSLVAEADALAFGSLLAIVIREDVSRKLIIRHFGMWGGGLGVLGMAVCTISTGLAAYWVPATWTLNPLNLALLSFMACFFGGLLMIAVLADNSSIARILNNPFLSHIGKISYGIYLYHYVVFFFVDALFNKIRIAFGISSPLLLSIVIKILVTYLVALLSYYLVELRFLQLKNRFSYAPIQNSGVVCIDFAYSRQQKTVQ